MLESVENIVFIGAGTPTDFCSSRNVFTPLRHLELGLNRLVKYNLHIYSLVFEQFSCSSAKLGYLVSLP